MVTSGLKPGDLFFKFDHRKGWVLVVRGLNLLNPHFLRFFDNATKTYIVTWLWHIGNIRTVTKFRCSRAVLTERIRPSPNSGGTEYLMNPIITLFSPAMQNILGYTSNTRVSRIYGIRDHKQQSISWGGWTPSRRVPRFPIYPNTACLPHHR